MEVACIFNSEVRWFQSISQSAMSCRDRSFGYREPRYRATRFNHGAQLPAWDTLEPDSNAMQLKKLQANGRSIPRPAFESLALTRTEIWDSATPTEPRFCPVSTVLVVSVESSECPGAGWVKANQSFPQPVSRSSHCSDEPGWRSTDRLLRPSCRK